MRHTLRIKLNKVEEQPFVVVSIITADLPSFTQYFVEHNFVTKERRGYGGHE